MVGIILISIAARILSCSTAVTTESNQQSTQSSDPLDSSSTERGSSSSSSAVDDSTSSNSLTRSTLGPTWSVELQHPVWIVWADVNVPTDYGTRAITMITANKDTVMPCNAKDTWISSTTLRITCRNVVNATNIMLVSTDTMVSKLGLIEIYVYEDCQPDSSGQECGTLCSPNCTESLCDHMSGTCTCVLGWKGDSCDGDTFSRSNKTNIPADTSAPSINTLFVGVVGTGITAVVVVLAAIVVLLVRRHRQRSQRTLEQAVYDDIFNEILPGGNAQHSHENQSSVDYDIIDDTSRDQDEQQGKTSTYISPIPREGESGAQNPGCEENHCELHGSYDVFDVTSRDPDAMLDKPYTDLTIQSSREDDSKGGYDVLDVTSRDPDEACDKPYTDLTINTPRQSIPRTDIPLQNFIRESI